MAILTCLGEGRRDEKTRFLVFSLKWPVRQFHHPLVIFIFIFRSTAIREGRKDLDSEFQEPIEAFMKFERLT